MWKISRYVAFSAGLRDIEASLSSTYIIDAMTL